MTLARTIASLFIIRYGLNMTIREEKVEKFMKLYEQIHACYRCIGAPGCQMSKDSNKVMRVVETRALASEVFLIGQALGGSTQRVSGRPYFYKNEKLSPTGQRLNKFLGLFGYTIDPFGSSSWLQYVYSSDIVQCYPGKSVSGHSDRKPGNDETFNCIKQGFLLEELKLIEPRLLLLMGKASRDSFYKYVLHMSHPNSLSEHIHEIVQNGSIPRFNLHNRDLFIVPIQHPSGANPQFLKMFNNEKIIELIREILE